MRRSRSMPATIRLLGPDLGNSPLLVEVEPTDTIEILKKHTLEKWPAGARAPPPPLGCLACSACDFLRIA